jgi:hypothetical protein
LIGDYINLSLKNEIEMDLRWFQILIDHKVMMQTGIKYFFEKKIIEEISIYEKYEEIKKDLMLLKNMMVKNTIKRDDDIIRKVIDKMPDIAESEKIAAESLLDLIIKL